MTFNKALIVLLAVVLILFIFQNTEVVSIKFLFWRFSMSGILLYTIIFFLGFAAGIIGYIFYQKFNAGKGESL